MTSKRLIAHFIHCFVYRQFDKLTVVKGLSHPFAYCSSPDGLWPSFYFWINCFRCHLPRQMFVANIHCRISLSPSSLLLLLLLASWLLLLSPWIVRNKPEEPSDSDRDCCVPLLRRVCFLPSFSGASFVPYSASSSCPLAYLLAFRFRLQSGAIDIGQIVEYLHRRRSFQRASSMTSPL